MPKVAPERLVANGADEVVRFLGDRGCAHIFGLPGSSLVSLIHALEQSDIDIVPTVHEAVTVAAADGYSRVKGAGFAYLYMLPGTANGLANLYNAWRDESPVLVLASQQASTWRTREGTIGEADILRAAEPFTRFSQEIGLGTPVRRLLDSAWRAATGYPGGPAFVSLPGDVLENAAPVRPARASLRVPAGAPDVGVVAARLAAAERPLIIAGGQLRRYGGVETLARLAEVHGIALATEPGFLDRLPIPPGHPRSIGSLTGISGSVADARADVVVMVGGRLVAEGHPRVDEWFAGAGFVAHVNADPAKLEETRTADWACACDPAAFVAALAAALAPPTPDQLAARIDFIAGCRATPLPDLPFLKTLAAYGQALAGVHDALERGWVVDEAVMGSIALIQSLKTGDGSRYVGATGGSLGWGTGAAVGVALASGEPVTCVLGDGALRFGAQGLWTAVARRLPITYVVLDNGGYGSTRYFAREFAAREGNGNMAPAYAGMDLRAGGSDVTDILRGFGVSVGDRVDPAGARGAIEAAWAAATDGPNSVVIDLPFGD